MNAVESGAWILPLASSIKNSRAPSESTPRRLTRAANTAAPIKLNASVDPHKRSRWRTDLAQRAGRLARELVQAALERLGPALQLRQIRLQPIDRRARARQVDGRQRLFDRLGHAIEAGDHFAHERHQQALAVHAIAAG